MRTHFYIALPIDNDFNLAILVMAYPVGGWMSGHRPEVWVLALPCIIVLFTFGLLSIFVWNQDAPRPPR